MYCQESNRGNQMKSRRRIFGSILVLGALVLGSSSAFAANSQYCTGTWVCVYTDSNWGAPMGWRSAGFALQDISLANNDKMSSWENRTGTSARWYTDANGGGACHTMAKFSEVGNLLPWENDTMSSWSGTRGC
jgi:hypothetical protein